MKANDRSLYVGVAFSDPAVGMYKLLVDMQSTNVDIKSLWENMSDHKTQQINLDQFKVETLVKQQYKIHSCDPLYVLVMTDNTTTFTKAKDITKRYMERMQSMTSMSIGHICPPDLLPKVKELEDKLL